MKTSTQLKALIRNLSKSKNIEAEILLRSFMFERFLERVSLSVYKDSFILKGGMLIAAMIGVDTRTTMDLDATIKKRIISRTDVSKIIEDILCISIDDGVMFSLRDIQLIHEEADYPGYRVSITASLEKTRQIIKIDLSSGDPITPREIEYNYQLMFEDRSINIMTYNLETILSEKFESIISRGTTNSRMRDFYDIYILTKLLELNPATFITALARTTENRGTNEQMSDANNAIEIIKNNAIMKDLWQKYSINHTYADGVTWDTVINALHGLAKLLK